MINSLSLIRPFVWLSRLRYRCGYGVHSPFAFSLITDVIYEKTPYYAYQTLASEQKKCDVECRVGQNRKKENRLLFRLVNRMQPRTIVEVGCKMDSFLYMQAAKPTADYTFASGLSDLFLESGVSLDFAYLNSYKNPLLIEESFNICAGRATADSLFVIKGIGYSKAMRTLWKRLKEDDRVGITFDLFDVGLLFFDKTKIKQHYIVNF